MRTPHLTPLLFALCVLTQPALAGARPGVPLENIQDAVLPAPPGRDSTLAEVEAALTRAATKRNWILESQGPGKVLGTLQVRGKHTIRVDLAYTARTLTLTYRDSNNMNYETYTAPLELDSGAMLLGGRASKKFTEGQALIHPNYNVWVRDLLKEVRQELTLDRP